MQGEYLHPMYKLSHSEKMTIWCALWRGGTINRVFFPSNEISFKTVNFTSYRGMFKTWSCINITWAMEMTIKNKQITNHGEMELETTTLQKCIENQFGNIIKETRTK